MAARTPKPTRPRAERRAEARQTGKDVRERERLARLEPGGAPDRPIEVITASLVEPRAKGMPCAVCGHTGSVRLDDHTARTIDGDALRLAHVRCAMCGYARVVYFAIRPPLLN
jgi:hypothetical protein